jgi:hypothetical protein
MTTYHRQLMAEQEAAYNDLRSLGVEYTSGVDDADIQLYEERQSPPVEEGVRVLRAPTVEHRPERHRRQRRRRADDDRDIQRLLADDDAVDRNTDTDTDDSDRDDNDNDDSPPSRRRRRPTVKDTEASYPRTARTVLR